MSEPLPVVVVAVRGIPADDGAVRHAVEYAGKLGAQLRVIRLDVEPTIDVEGLLHEALAAVAAPPPTQILRRRGDLAAVLICESVRAAGLVVGTPVDPNVAATDPLLLTLRRATPCPLLEVSAAGALLRASGPVARPRGDRTRAASGATPSETPDRRVVTVGFDGSPSSLDALGWALDHARLVGANVELVTAITDADWQSGSRRQHMGELQRAALRQLDPDHRVSVATASVRGAPVDVLTRLSEHSQLLVLGRHSTQGLVHSALGAVSDACTRLASCPVVVVAEGPARPTTTLIRADPEAQRPVRRRNEAAS